jgi:type IV pilus assembly protein PilQ
MKQNKNRGQQTKLVGSWYLALVLLWLLPLTVSAQEEETPREYAPEEFISLSKDMTIDAALEIINQLSTKYEGRMILDPKDRKSKIGVDVVDMHWKRALEYILKSNLLKYVVHPRHYEISEMVEPNEKAAAEDQLSFGSREVEIKAIFFEADQQTLAEVGVDWSTLRNGTVQVRADLTGTKGMADELFAITGGYQNQTWRVFALIKAFQSLNKGQVIATPQVRILEGEEGKIKVGKNFFLTTRDFAGNTRYSEYESGIILTVVPQIITQGKLSFIHLQISAEKSDVVPGAVNVIKKITEGRTQVLLLNGEETAMAGLISNEQITVRKGVPILKDLPWWLFGVRYLFGFNSQQVTRKELVILIKAEIVPSLVNRLKSKVRTNNYLQEQQRDFEKRSRELQKK